METKNFEDRLQNLNELDKDEQLQLRNEILAVNPRLIRPWLFWTRCEVNVLVVTDTGLDFGLSGFGLSNFLTIFKKLEAESNVHIRYNVTLAHRANPGSAGMQSTNPDFINKISNFRFDDTSHFTRSKYDQVWLFAFSTTSINPNEVNAINDYMNHGGGVFATGDHGNIGIGMCGNITRVKDMRHWQDFGNGEVSMGGSRRNDTNVPHSGNASSTVFADQSDAIPQNIHARMYGTAPNLLPHYLLSIKKSIKASGVIDIMPDHPHEGECKSERDFTVVNPKTGNPQTIRTQNIAISFVSAGNTAGFKQPTNPHCFASIGVFDGRIANVGRIVIDSTWHHFVNVNLQGFTTGTMNVIFEYYKNIAKWMTRRKNMLCRYKRLVIHTMLSEKIIEANTHNLDIRADDIPNDELFAIGQHAVDIIESESSAADALQFQITMLESVAPELAKKIDIWDLERKDEEDFTHNQFINYKPLVLMSIGLGIARVKDIIGFPDKPIQEKDEIIIKNVFEDGVADGFKKSMSLFEQRVSLVNKIQKETISKEYVISGKITDAKGNPIIGVTVRAVDVDFTAENVLGNEVTTDKNGVYKINYKYTDFVINGKESGGADIVIYVFNKEGKQIGKSEMYSNSPKEFKIDLKLK